MTLEEVKAHLSTLAPAEKLEVIRLLISDLANIWPGIEELPSPHEKLACIKGVPYSVFPVWVLEGYRRAGRSEAQILEQFSGLRAEDLVNAWAYADAHPNEMEAALRENSILDWRVSTSD